MGGLGVVVFTDASEVGVSSGSFGTGMTEKVLQSSQADAMF